MSNYYQEHKEELKARSRINYQNNREHRIKQNKEWKENNRETYLQGLKDWRKNNKDKIKEQAQKRRQERRLWIQEIKSKLYCVKCDMNKIECLDFHHSNPKEKDSAIAKVIYRWSKQRILNEIKKCIVLCSNCHRTEHYQP